METKVALIAGCLVLFAYFCDKTTASDKIPKLYEEIGCTEVKENGVTSYNCPDVKAYDTSKCHLKGKTYNAGEDIDSDELHCKAACKCLKHGNEEAKIVCAHIECPEHFGPRGKPDCVNRYDSLKQCCRSGQICGQEKRSLGHCEYEGKTYSVGEKIYPEHSCHNCLCTVSFNNLTSVEENPDCVKTNCGIELHLDDIKKGCVPVYWETPNCCPIEYRCPDKSDTIDAKSAAGEKLTCKYGDLTLKRGDELKTGDKCLKCECSVPPYVTCTKTSKC